MTIQRFLPDARDEDLQQWKDRLKMKGLTEAEIKEAGFAMGASSYVKEKLHKIVEMDERKP